MESLIHVLNSPDIDNFTRLEIKFFIEKKIAEHEKFRGQIGHDLERLGDNAWREESAYRKLKEKYLRAHQSRKKLAILDLMKNYNCRGGDRQ